MVSSRTQSPQLYVYTSVIRAHIGDSAARIVSTLISYGRLTAREISVRSKLPLKQVKTSLVSLIQLNCVLYWTEKSNTYYSFESRGVRVWLHSGEIIMLVKKQYGTSAAEITQNVVENGHVKIQDILNTIDDKHLCMKMLQKLYMDGWFEKLKPFHFNPIEDVWAQIFEETQLSMPRNATTSEVKRLAEIKEVSKNKLKQLLEAEDVGRLDENSVIRFNLNRLEKHLRTQAFVDLARSRIGLLTAKVFETALQLVERNSPDVSLPFLNIAGVINDPEEARQYLSSIENGLVDNRKTVFSIRDVASALSEDIDLTNSILTHNFLKPFRKRLASNHDIPTKKIKLEDDDDISALPSGSIDNDTSVSLVQHHLRLLASSTAIPFLNELGPGTFTVPYSNLMKDVKELNYEYLIKSTMGSESLRVLRCLKSLKLADEKTLANSVLLKEKTVRNEVYKLVKMNVVEIQEVPRSADRAASKTFYLFRHKPVSAYSYLSNSLLFSMGEILTTISDLKEDHKILLAKCEREDVKGHEEDLLLESELRTLTDFQTRQTESIARFNRIKLLYVLYGIL